MRAVRRFVASGEPLEVRSLLSQFGPSSPTPAARLDPYAIGRQQQDLAQVQAGQGSGVVFLGDSITDNWDNWNAAGAATWDARLAPIGAADFAVAGNTTANVLWQIEQGDLAGKPKVVALMIGTNDLGLGASVDQTIRGVEAVVAAIHRASPGSEILLQGILPRGAGASDPVTLEIDRVNAAVSALASADPLVRYVDFGSAFLDPNGSIPKSLMPDRLHPAAAGYRIWADAVVPTLDAMLGQSGQATASITAATTATPAPTNRSAAKATPVPADFDPGPFESPTPTPLFLIPPGLDPAEAPPILPGSADPATGHRPRPSSTLPTDPFLPTT